MKRIFRLAFGSIAVAGVLMAGAIQASDEGTAKHGAKSAKKDADKTAKPKWAVVKVGDETKAVQEDKIKALEADLEKAAAKAAKDHKDSKDKDHKGKAKKIDTKVALVKGGFATEKEALKFIEDEKAKALKGTKEAKGHKEKDGTSGAGKSGKTPAPK